MVVKRQCSFCAGEIEPGTGMMFVKRDGTVFHFCTSSCRKQQLHLGRVGHRLKWTRAHALKRAAEQAGAKTAEARAGGSRRPIRAPSPSAPAAPAPAAPAPAAGAAAATPAPAAAKPAPRAKKEKSSAAPAKP
ncbi:MAG TPA: 50S ribosomal protein L24e [Thermoplasmata archaeon]|nr:50S ribosomal protein L24e [Thermoplasmata archaeon]